MSYCRWSNEVEGRGLSDVYVYERSPGGVWVVHLARTQRLFAETMPPPVDPTHNRSSRNAWFKRSKLMDAIAKESTPLNHPLAGKTLSFGSPGEAADLLQELRDAGLLVPQQAINDLREEQAELDFL